MNSAQQPNTDRGPAVTATLLIEELEMMRAIMATSSDVVFAKDLHGRMKFANPAALALIGKPLKDVLGRTDAEFLEDKGAAEAVMTNDRRVMSTGVAEEVEEEVPLLDGSRRVWLSQKKPYYDSTGNVVGILGVSRDITERKLQAEKLESSNTSLQRVLDSISDGLAILDNEWRYTYFSETGAKMLGLRSEDLKGQCLWDLFPHAEQSQFGLQYRLAVSTKVATHFEEYYPYPLNRWLECHCYPYADGLSVYFRDVSDRHAAQEAVEETERRISAIFEATPVGLAYANNVGEIVLMNNECKRQWGEPPKTDNIQAYSEYKGWWADGGANHGKSISFDEWPTAKTLAGEKGGDAIVEIEPFSQPGTRKTLLLRSVPIKDRNGSITGAVTAQMDIGEVMQAKASVQESGRQLKQLANTIPQLAWMADPTGYIHWYNDRWYEYTGTTPSEMEGWGWKKVHHPDTVELVTKEWQRSLATGEAFEMSFRIRSKNGEYRMFYTLVEPLRDSLGNITQWFGTNTDVSKIQSVQDELRRTQTWLQEGFSAGKMVAWEWSIESNKVRYSDNVSQVLGVALDETIEGVWACIHPDDIESMKSTVRNAIRDVGALDIVNRRIKPDSKELTWIHTKAKVLRDHNGIAECIRGIFVDITEETLRRTALEESGKRKDEFLAMLAHELRNPLAPITTAAHLLSMVPNDPKKVLSSASIIARQVGHMASLIDDLLDVSRVTRGLVELDRMPVNVSDFVNNAVEQAKPLIDLKGHSIAVTYDSPSLLVLGDKVRLCQVLSNILTNAAKYTPAGGVIKVEVKSIDVRVVLTITDNGIGIDEHLLPHVFELFTQASRSADRAQGGLGLGLALVDSLVRMHGGKVEAYSGGVGRGSRFVVILPRLITDYEETVSVAEKTEHRGFPVRNILIVDDNVDAANTLAAVLGMEGHAVTIADRPSEALKVAKQKRFDLMILDIGLPEMDGYALAKKIREDRNSQNSFLVALTGYGQAKDRELSRSAGFDLHLVKPVPIEELYEVLQKISET